LAMITDAGINYENRLKTLTMAMDLAAMKQIDLSSAAMLLNRAFFGQATMLQRLGIEVKSGAKGYEVLAEVEKYLTNNGKNRLGKIAEDAIDPFRQLTNEIGDFWQMVAKPAYEKFGLPIVLELKELYTALNDLGLDGIKEKGAEILKAVGVGVAKQLPIITEKMMGDISEGFFKIGLGFASIVGSILTKMFADIAGKLETLWDKYGGHAGGKQDLARRTERAAKAGGIAGDDRAFIEENINAILQGNPAQKAEMTRLLVGRGISFEAAEQFAAAYRRQRVAGGNEASMTAGWEAGTERYKNQLISSHATSLMASGARQISGGFLNMMSDSAENFAGVKDIIFPSTSPDTDVRKQGARMTQEAIAVAEKQQAANEAHNRILTINTRKQEQQFNRAYQRGVQTDLMTAY